MQTEIAFDKSEDAVIALVGRSLPVIEGIVPHAWVRDGQVFVSGEEGDGLVDYWGWDDCPYICPQLEKWADDLDSYWEWETPGSICLCKI